MEIKKTANRRKEACGKKRLVFEMKKRFDIGRKGNGKRRFYAWKFYISHILYNFVR